MSLTNGDNQQEATTVSGVIIANDVIEANVVLTPDLLKSLELAIGSVGMITNLVVSVVLLHEKKMMTLNTNIYILSQSLVDLFVSLTLILTVLIENDGRYFEGPGDSIFCVFWLSRVMLFGLFTSSICNLVVMTVERYLAIVRPVWHKLHVTRKRVVISVVVAWIFGVLFHAVMKIPTARVDEGRCLLYQWPTPTIALVTGLCNFFVQYLGPLIIISTTYCHMIIKLRMRISPDEAGSGMSRARKNVIRTMVIVNIGLVLCLSLNKIYFLMFNFGYNLTLKSELYHASILLAFVNCTINPFIYLVNYQAYQRALGKLVGRLTGGRLTWGTRENNLITSGSTVDKE